MFSLRKNSVHLNFNRLVYIWCLFKMLIYSYLCLLNNRNIAFVRYKI